MTTKYKIGIFFTITIMLLSLYSLFYYYQIGRGVKAEWWIKNVTEKKIDIAQKPSSGRLVIISGSNGLFGINSDVISKDIGKPVINLAIHAGLDLGYYRMLLDKVLRRDDVVIMPLEYSYYGKKDMFTEWQVNNILAWGKEYLDWMSLSDKVDFFIHTPASRVVDGLLSPSVDKFDSEEKVSEYIPEGKDYGLDYRSLNTYGDLNLDRPSAKAVKDLILNKQKNAATLSYGKSSSYISDYTYNQLELIRRLVYSRGARMYLSWPASMETEYFNKNDTQAVSFTNDIKRKLELRGYHFVCSPFDSNLNQRLFLDTYYHLTSSGARLRSEAMSKCLHGI